MTKISFALVIIMFLVIAPSTLLAQNENPAGDYSDYDITLPDGRIIDIDTRVDTNLLFLNGGLVMDYSLINRNDRILAPMGLFSEKIEADMTWNETKNEITILQDNVTIVFTIDSETSFVNGKAVQLDSPPVICNSIVYIPLRFALENLGYSVIYSEPMSDDYEYYYNTRMPVSPEKTIVRGFPNIIVDTLDDSHNLYTKDDALVKTKEICMQGLKNFSVQMSDRFKEDMESIEMEINRMLYIGEVSKYYKFTIGPYDILFDKLTGDTFFVIYSSSTIIKKVDINDPGLFTYIFIVG